MDRKELKDVKKNEENGFLENILSAGSQTSISLSKKGRFKVISRKTSVYVSRMERKSRLISCN